MYLEAEKSVLQSVDNTINLIGSGSGKSKRSGKPLPGCLKSTSFFEKPSKRAAVSAAARPPPDHNNTNESIKAIDCVYLDEDENQGETYVHQLYERSLHRSFQESGAVEVYDVDAKVGSKEQAVQRVNYLMDDPVKATTLIEMYSAQMEKADKKIDSPGVNAMLDKFIG